MNLTVKRGRSRTIWFTLTRHNPGPGDDPIGWRFALFVELIAPTLRLHTHRAAREYWSARMAWMGIGPVGVGILAAPITRTVIW